MSHRDAPAVVLDLSRLATRFTRLAPNGIDRVDLGVARAALASERVAGAIVLGLTGPRFVSVDAAARVVSAIAAHWSEAATPEQDPLLADIKRWLISGDSPCGVRRAPSKRSAARDILRLYVGTDAAMAQRLLPGAQPRTAVPRNAIYMNCSQFPVWEPRYFRWLAERPDVHALFLIHDLLPLRYPEFFPPREAGIHRRRMDVVATRASSLLTTTPAVATDLRDAMAARGRCDLPIQIEPLPVDATFATHGTRDDELASVPYFVTCGTVEARKNHLMLLHIWREIVAELGVGAPRLVIVGTRGWDSENAVDLLERSVGLGGAVLEVDGLSTPALARLMANARAVLQPSFAEGFGLPAAEALASGARIVAAPDWRGDLPEGSVSVDALDGAGWKSAIYNAQRFPRLSSQTKQHSQCWESYFRNCSTDLRRSRDVLT